MRVAVFGLGALGGIVASRFACHPDFETTVVVKSDRLEAVEAAGLRMVDADGETLSRPAKFSADPAALPPQDLVVVTLKATGLSAAADGIAALLRGGGTAVFVLNGIPWWYRYGTDAPAYLPLLDPDGHIWRTVGPERVIGCLSYRGARVIGPGAVQVYGTERWDLGEPTGGNSDRLRMIADAFETVGLTPGVSTDIRRAIWQKLVLNLAFNPLTALTRLDTVSVTDDPGLFDLAVALVEEALTISAGLGCDIRSQVDIRAALTRGNRVRGARPSMLQDADARRPMEVEAIVGQVQAFGKDLGYSTPRLDLIAALLRGLNRASSLVA
jgi:2-dehydropantoate 2-reductase